MSLSLFLLLIILLLGALPACPYSRRWGYGPSGLLGLARQGEPRLGRSLALPGKPDSCE